MNNNHILYTHPIVGNITFNDMIQDLQIIIDDLSFFESIILNILQDSTYLSDEDISSLFNYFPIDRIKWILDLLQISNEK